MHPDFSILTFENDIAVAWLDGNVNVTEGVSPICVTREMYTPGEYCVVTGWGTTSIGKWAWLDGNVNVTEGVSPICVTKEMYTAGEYCVVTGWGTTSIGKYVGVVRRQPQCDGGRVANLRYQGDVHGGGVMYGY